MTKSNDITITSTPKGAKTHIAVDFASTGERDERTTKRTVTHVVVAARSIASVIAYNEAEIERVRGYLGNGSWDQASVDRSNAWHQTRIDEATAAREVSGSDEMYHVSTWSGSAAAADKAARDAMKFNHTTRAWVVEV